MVLEHRRPAVAEQELELAELRRLEAARRLEPRAEQANDIGVMVSRMSTCATIGSEDGQHPLQGVADLRGQVRLLAVAVEEPAEVVELVQHLLEPQLVDLVDDDEEVLVVLGVGPVLAGARHLQLEELFDLEILRVK